MEAKGVKVFEVKNASTNSLVVEEKQPLSTDLYDKLNNFFSEESLNENTIFEAKDILKNDSRNLTDEQILDLISNVQYLVGSWIEEFERGIFQGKSFEEEFNPNTEVYAK